MFCRPLRVAAPVVNVVMSALPRYFCSRSPGGGTGGEVCRLRLHLLQTEGLLKVSGNHVHCKCAIISGGVQERVVVTIDH